MTVILFSGGVQLVSVSASSGEYLSRVFNE